mgnify:CR=1 FL=1
MYMTTVDVETSTFGANLNREITWAHPAGRPDEAPIAKVLVVDDKPEIAEVTAKTLTDAGLLCDMAGGSREALDALRADCEISIVVIDTKLSGVNGEEIIRGLHECRAGGRELAIIIVTDCRDINNTIASLRQGAMDFLIRPVAAEYLACATVRAAARMPMHAKPKF